MYRSDITKSACSYPCFVCTVSLQEMIESLSDCDSQHIWAQSVTLLSVTLNFELKKVVLSSCLARLLLVPVHFIESEH